MTQYTREQLLELAPAYALGATTREESAAVEAAMRTSPELAAEVASFSDVTAKLAQQQAMAPSPGVRAVFLDRVAQSKNPALVVAPPQPRSTPSWMPVALAASVLLAVGVTVQTVRVSELRSEIERRNSALTTALQEAERRTEQLNTILEGDKDLHLIHMKAADTVGGPGIQFFWNAKQQRGLVHAFRLQPAPAGRAYQVWLLVKGQPVGIKVFNSDVDGHALVTGISLPPTIEGVSDVLITEEPAGGSPLPTTTPFIGGKLRAG